MEQANKKTYNMSNNHNLDLYSAYLIEREDANIVSNKTGFATYRFQEYEGIEIVYIMDIYVIPEHRNAGAATELGLLIEDIAKDAGVHQVLGSVDTACNGAEASIKVLKAYGMTELFQVDTMIYFIKEI